MKKVFVLFVILSCAIVDVVQSRDVFHDLVDIGLCEYNKNRGPYAKNPWDMMYFDGGHKRIYIGQGNSDNNGSPDGNAGPMKVGSFVPGVPNITFEGANGGASFPEEQTDRFYIYDGSLCWGGHDPQLNWTQRTFYRLDSTSTSGGDKWKKFVSCYVYPTTKTIDDAFGIHVYDLLEYKGKLYDVGYSYAVSTDKGAYFNKIFSDGSRKSILFTVQDKFYSADWEGSVYVYELDVIANTETYKSELSGVYNSRKFFPGFRVTGRNRANSYFKAVRSVSLPNGFALYLGGIKTSDHQCITNDVFVAKSLEANNVDITRTTPGDINNGERAWDLVARGNVVYLLTSKKVVSEGSVESFTVSVWKSSADYLSWTQVFAVNGLPTFARSFEEISGSFALGLGTDDGYAESAGTTSFLPIPEEVYTNVKPDSGRILWVSKSVIETPTLALPAAAAKAKTEEETTKEKRATNSQCSVAQSITVPFNEVLNVSGSSGYSIAKPCWPTETSSKTKALWFSLVGNGQLLRAFTCTNISAYKTNSRISVYDSCPASSTSMSHCIAHNNDNDVCGTYSTQSSLMWYAKSGVTYYIELSSGYVFPGKDIIAKLQIAAVTTGVCDTTTVSVGTPATGKTLSATSLPFSSCSNRVNSPAGEWTNRKIAWFAVQGTGGRLRATVTGGTWIAGIEVRSSCYGLATDDDCIAFTDEYTSMPVEWNSVSGTTYYVVVYQTFMSATATSFTLTLTTSTIVSNSFCSAAQELNLTTSTVLTSNTLAATSEKILSSCDVFSREDAFGGMQSLWYKVKGDGLVWKATTCAGTATTAWNAMVEVYESCPTTTQSASCVNKWSQPTTNYCSFLNSAVWFSQPGKNYYLRVTSGFTKAAGTATVSFSTLKYVSCTTATTISGLSATGNMSSSGYYWSSPKQELKYFQTSWMKYTATESNMYVTATVTAKRATWIEVFSSCSSTLGTPETGTLLASGFGPVDQTAKASWVIKNGMNYWISVSSIESTTVTGIYDLNLKITADLPSDNGEGTNSNENENGDGNTSNAGILSCFISFFVTFLTLFI